MTRHLFTIGLLLYILRLSALIDWSWWIVTLPWWLIVGVFCIKSALAIATQIALWRKATRVD